MRSGGKEYYQSLDTRLSALLPELQSTIPLENWRWFEEWIRAGEYGLAAEVAAESLVAVAKVPASLASELLSIAKMMALESDPIIQLRSRVSGSPRG